MLESTACSRSFPRTTPLSHITEPVTPGVLMATGVEAETEGGVGDERVGFGESWLLESPQEHRLLRCPFFPFPQYPHFPSVPSHSLIRVVFFFDYL
uniref:Protein N-lysine methyltransferase METTL21A n=1 Tax=Rhizophora mucronata TaxID=61149 RepID=A0A2P2K546_RHIMU